MAILKVAVSSSDHQLGSERAPITLVEYGDYQCPYCSAAAPVVRDLRKRFGSQLRFVFRNFPLSEIHPHAEAAAQVAEFADENGKFWQMHDLLFENQSRFGDLLFAELVEQLDLSSFDLRESLTLGVHKRRVQADIEGGVRSGVNGTPTFFINSVRHDAPNDEASLARAIYQALTRCERRHGR
jgi:protein-disulfide isomerase